MSFKGLGLNWFRPEFERKNFQEDKGKRYTYCTFKLYVYKYNIKCVLNVLNLNKNSLNIWNTNGTIVQIRNTGKIAVLPVFRYGKIKRNSSIKIIKIILPPLLYDTKV